MKKKHSRFTAKITASLIEKKRNEFRKKRENSMKICFFIKQIFATRVTSIFAFTHSRHTLVRSGPMRALKTSCFQ